MRQEQIANILRDNSHYSPQTGGYVIQGAIEKLMEWERGQMIELLEWLTRADSPYAVLYGEDPERFEGIEADYTCGQLVDEFLSLQNQSKKNE